MMVFATYNTFKTCAILFLLVNFSEGFKCYQCNDGTNCKASKSRNPADCTKAEKDEGEFNACIWTMNSRKQLQNQACVNKETFAKWIDWTTDESIPSPTCFQNVTYMDKMYAHGCMCTKEECNKFSSAHRSSEAFKWFLITALFLPIICSQVCVNLT